MKMNEEKNINSQPENLSGGGYTRNLGRRKGLLILIAILLIGAIGIGLSYAYWMLSFTQEEKNQVNTACFDIKFDDSDTIHLEKAYPMTDEEGKSLTPYKVTVTNKCEEYASYQVNLEILNTTTMDPQYMKISVNNVISTLNTNQVVESTIESAVTSYRLETGYLDKLESKTFEISLWLDYEAPIETAGKILESKVTIQTAYSKNYPANVLAARVCTSYYNCKDTTRVFQAEYFDNTTKIVFQNKMNPPAEYIAEFDESKAKDGSIKAYVVRNEDGTTYTIYFQTRGNFEMTDGSFYFSGFIEVTEIEGLEYVDTSNVTNMRNMFKDMSSLTNLDLSHFDTSNVTDMGYMFNEMSSLTSLDLSSFDTSKVTDMSEMFSYDSSLTSLDLSGFDTSQVTSMSGMFNGISKLENLDVSHFNTSKVTDMSGMFDSMKGLTSLDISNFDTSKVYDMSYMFMNMTNLTSLDLSSFDTSKVTDMSRMLSYDSSLTSLDLSGFDTNNVTSMEGMFSGTSAITSLDLSHFNTSNVTNMSWMFERMKGLTSLDLSSFDTSNVTNMNAMFQFSSNLVSITYGEKFIRKEGADLGYMFRSCPANKPTHSSWDGAFTS